MAYRLVACKRHLHGRLGGAASVLKEECRVASSLKLAHELPPIPPGPARERAARGHYRAVTDVGIQAGWR